MHFTILDEESVRYRTKKSEIHASLATTCSFDISPMAMGQVISSLPGES
jgi:hypothetical protein